VNDGGQAVIVDINQGGGVVNNLEGEPHENIPRCGARTRSGGSCGHYAMPDGRCRYHGGLSTGPKNPRVKHGYYTKKAIAERKLLDELLQDANDFASEVCG